MQLNVTDEAFLFFEVPIWQMGWSCGPWRNWNGSHGGAMNLKLNIKFHGKRRYGIKNFRQLTTLTYHR